MGEHAAGHTWEHAGYMWCMGKHVGHDTAGEGDMEYGAGEQMRYYTLFPLVML